MGYNTTESARAFLKEYRRELGVLMGLSPNDRRVKIDRNYMVASEQQDRAKDTIPPQLMGATAATGIACLRTALELSDHDYSEIGPALAYEGRELLVFSGVLAGDAGSLSARRLLDRVLER